MTAIGRRGDRDARSSTRGRDGEARGPVARRTRRHPTAHDSVGMWAALAELPYTVIRCACSVLQQKRLKAHSASTTSDEAGCPALLTRDTHAHLTPSRRPRTWAEFWAGPVLVASAASASVTSIPTATWTLLDHQRARGDSTRSSTLRSSAQQPSLTRRFHSGHPRSPPPQCATHPPASSHLPLSPSERAARVRASDWPPPLSSAG